MLSQDARSDRSCRPTAGVPANSSSVGATSARTPSWRASPSAARPTSTNGTGFSECAVTACPSASRSSSALPWSAVIASSAPGPAGSRASTVSIAATIRARQPSITVSASIVASQTPVWPTMSGFAKFATIRSYVVRLDRLDERVGHADGAHRRGEVVGRDLRARDEPAVLARMDRLDAAVEEVRDVRVLLGLRDVALPPARVGDRVGERADDLGRERDLGRQAGLVLGHRDDQEPRGRRAAGGRGPVEPGERRAVGEGMGQLARPVGPEVGVDRPGRRRGWRRPGRR